MLSNQDNEPFIAKNDALGYVHGEKLYKQIESHFEAYLIKLHQVAQCLVDEENRIKSYLHPSTLEPILKILDNVLIRDNLDRILDEAEFLFNNSRNQGEHVSIIHSPIIALRIRFCALMPKQINVARSEL
ncbi:unnamed protein product [Rotaria sp. Silwood1]|nr:unnamed protein product [Rotaria sp. Silwood1]CAF3571209.1 unnamed protein product [Rotaria sp. Silwood1]